MDTGLRSEARGKKPRRPQRVRPVTFDRRHRNYITSTRRAPQARFGGERTMRPFGLQSSFVATCLIAIAGAVPAIAAPHQPGSRGIDRRGDVRNLPAPLKARLVELANRPHTYPPLTVFS